MAGKVHSVLLVAAQLLLIVDPATAQDAVECFSKFTRFNICEKARELQRQMAKSLPMKISTNITLSAVAVVGPRLALTAIWYLNKADLDASLAANKMSLADLRARMNQATQNSVCSQNLMAAFVRLGGQIQYIYKTEDQFVVLSPTVTTCEISN